MCRGESYRFPTDDEAKALADAFLRLRLEHDRAHSPAAEAAFQEEVKRYLAANPKPELPGDARRFKVQAESAIRDKRFSDAYERYTEALNLAPWWPEGRFNRALVLGEIGDFRTAIGEMKRYLLLVPDSPDSRAVQDKIYEWERKVR